MSNSVFLSSVPGWNVKFEIVRHLWVPVPNPIKSTTAKALSDTDFGMPKIMATGILIGAVKYLRKNQDLPKSKALDDRHWFGLDRLVLAIVCFGFILIVNKAGMKSRGCYDVMGNDDDLGGG
ncbi:hypothetical protein RJT34_19746 [Clitoria ternatea]|uniref:Uncharacterized protein n=1 Tax=Clitoria ternatea TaxID=43366 RepID=A0AAN9P4V8_CLITE